MTDMEKIDFPYIKVRQFKKKRKQESSKRTYIFVDLDKKQEFLNQFLFQGIKICQAAQNCGIKYSTAKTILYTHRQILRNKMKENKLSNIKLAKKKNEKLRCGVREVKKTEDRECSQTNQNNEMTQNHFSQVTNQFEIIVSVANVLQTKSIQ